MQDSLLIYSKINLEIDRLKQLWIVACKCHSVEGMAINSSIIEYLYQLMLELDLINLDEYRKVLFQFGRWKCETATVFSFC